jgi:hypothetical protein
MEWKVLIRDNELLHETQVAQHLLTVRGSPDSKYWHFTDRDLESGVVVDSHTLYPGGFFRLKDACKYALKPYKSLPEPSEPPKPMPKLDKQKARKIRALRKEGWSLSRLANEFGVDPSMISRICSGQRYRSDQQ